MKFNIDTRKLAKPKQNGAVIPVCALLILFLMFVMIDSVGASILLFITILLMNAYIFLSSDWKVSRKMDSVKTFLRIQNAALTFFLVEFVISLICVFYGWTGNIGILAAGFVTLLLSAAGMVWAILLKVDYDCYN